MIPDQTRMLDNLNRTARTAGHDTILETWKLRRLLAAAELAEADIAADGISEFGDTRGRWIEAAIRRASARIAYTAARESEIR